MECGWISPTTKILQSEQSPVGEVVSVNVISWIASSMSLSAILGVSFYIFILDNYGRKLGLILIAIPQVVSISHAFVIYRSDFVCISTYFCHRLNTHHKMD